MKKKKLYNPIWLKSEKFWYNFWRKVEAPWRPSRGEIKFWEGKVKEAAKRKGAKALVLGATPEIRDMLVKYKLDVTLIDLDPQVKRAADRLIKRRNKKEKLVKADWLKMPLPSDYFDIVIGDGNFENISLGKHNLFYRNIWRVVKPDGYVLMGRCCLDFAFKNPLSFKGLIEKYRKEPKRFKNLQNRILMLYRTASEPGVYDKRIQGLKFHILMEKLIKTAKKEGLSGREIENLYWMPGLLPPNLYYIEVDIESLKRLKKMISKYFYILDVYQDLFHPVMKLKYAFILKPKK